MTIMPDAIPDTYEQFLELCPEPTPTETEAPADEAGASAFPALVLADRCGFCTAQALIRGRIPGDETPWDFCKHHYETFTPALKGGDFEVTDDKPLRDLLEENRKKGES